MEEECHGVNIYYNSNTTRIFILSKNTNYDISITQNIPNKIYTKLAPSNTLSATGL
jgi:hypothetical protein